MGFETPVDCLMSKRSFHNPLDRLIVGADKALRVIGGVASASRPTPAAHAADGQLDEAANSATAPA
jgi:ubiquinone biosynthesis monooxygenase Coq7